jgi:hypothetical protein
MMEDYGRDGSLSFQKDVTEDDFHEILPLGRTPEYINKKNEFISLRQYHSLGRIFNSLGRDNDRSNRDFQFFSKSNKKNSLHRPASSQIDFNMPEMGKIYNFDCHTNDISLQDLNCTGNFLNIFI